MKRKWDQGSIELVVLGLLAALIVVLAIPLFSGVDKQVSSQPEPSSALVKESQSQAPSEKK